MKVSVFPTVSVCLAFLFSQYYWCSAYAVSQSLMADSWKDDMNKRNTWWTKKSVTDDDISVAYDSSKEDSVNADVKSVVGCFTSACMPAFINCFRTAEKFSYISCDEKHRLCLYSCIQESKDILAYSRK